MSHSSILKIKDSLQYENFQKGIDFNNTGYILDSRGQYGLAIAAFQKAIQVKIITFGEESVHVCVSLSGLADAYLHNKQYKEAYMTANKMLTIGLKIESEEQVKIAREILSDLSKVSK